MRDNVLLVDSAIAAIDAGDGRRVEIVATGLPYCQEVPLAVDATMVSPLHADGTAFPGAAEQPGVAFKRALRAKHATYPELVASHQLRLVVAAVETGGRLNRESLALLEQAAAAKARQAPVPLQRSMARVWKTRWTAMLSVATQTALAATLVNDGAKLLDAADGAAPPCAEAWLDGRA